jgi:hypothetical protein
MFYKMRPRTLTLGLIVLYTLFTLRKSFMGRDLHPAGLQLVDMVNFRFVLNHDICGGRNVALLTMVKSSIPNKVRKSVSFCWPCL